MSYLARLKQLDAGEIFQSTPKGEPTKPTEPPFDGFVGSVPGHIENISLVVGMGDALASAQKNEDYYPTIEDIDLLDSLIHELCDLQGDKAETREAMLDARRKMRPVLIPENIAQLRLWIVEVNHSEIMKGRA